MSTNNIKVGNLIEIMPMKWKALMETKTFQKKFSFKRARSLQNLELGQLFCRGRQRNVPKCETHVQSYLHTLCDVLAAVAIASYFK